MEDRVLGLFDERWEKLPTETDLQGIPRIVCARFAERAAGGMDLHVQEDH
jgi:hypothetical protein